VAEKTVEKFLKRAHRLYEQERGKPEGFPRLGVYVRRWQRWTTLGGVGVGLDDLRQNPAAAVAKVRAY
jgi:hypothetical protein